MSLKNSCMKLNKFSRRNCLLIFPLKNAFKRESVKIYNNNNNKNTKYLFLIVNKTYLIIFFHIIKIEIFSLNLKILIYYGR